MRQRRRPIQAEVLDFLEQNGGEAARPQILHALYGWPVIRRLTYHEKVVKHGRTWKLGTDNTPCDREDIAEHLKCGYPCFDRNAIGLAEYAKGNVTVSRACKRLEEQGLIVRVGDPYRWPAWRLKDS